MNNSNVNKVLRKILNYKKMECESINQLFTFLSFQTSRYKKV